MAGDLRMSLASGLDNVKVDDTNLLAGLTAQVNDNTTLTLAKLFAKFMHGVVDGKGAEFLQSGADAGRQHCGQ